MKKIIILLAFIISSCVGPPELFYHCIPDSKTINFEDKRNEYFESSIYEDLQMYPIKDSLLLYSQVSNLATGKLNNVKGLFFFVNNYEQTEMSFDFSKSLISSKNHNYDIYITDPPCG